MREFRRPCCNTDVGRVGVNIASPVYDYYWARILGDVEAFGDSSLIETLSDNYLLIL